MRMKKLLAILLLAAMVPAACSKDEDVLPQQRDKIESFLKSSHRPSLAPESEIEPSEAGNVSNYYSEFGDKVYRYIYNVNDPARADRREVTETSVATITFKLYVFTYSVVPDTRLPEYSNDKSLKLDYENSGLDISNWPFEPLAVDMSHTDILNGLHLALLGCREGDAVEAYMTYNMAYGDDHFGIIPRESPIYIYFTVDSVE